MAVSRQHLRQQHYAPAASSTTNTSTRTTLSTTSTMTSSARLTVAAWSVHPSKWSASTLAIKDATTSHRAHHHIPSFDNRSSTRAAAKCFVIKSATLSSVRTDFIKNSLLCPHVPDLQVPELPVPCLQTIPRQALLSLRTRGISS